MSPAQIKAVTAGVILAAAFVRLVTFNGLIGSDDIRYLEFAERFIRGQPFGEVDHAAGRLVFLLGMGIPAVGFGHGEFAALANLIIAVATDVAVAVFAWRTLSPAAALVAAVAVSFNPISLTYSTVVVPEVMLTALLFVGVSAISAGLARGGSAAALLGAGMLGGLAYGSKETAILALPPVGLFVLLLPVAARKRVAALALLGAGFATIYLLDGLVYLLYTGDFFYKVTATTAVHNRNIQPSHGFLDHLAAGGRSLQYASKHWAWTLLPMILGLPAMLGAAVLQPKLRLHMWVGAFVLLFLVFGTSSLSKLLPLPFQVRYLHPILPFSALAVAVFISSLAQRLPVRLSTGGLTAAALLYICLGSTVAGLQSGRLGRSLHIRQAALAFHILQNEGIEGYADPWTARCLAQLEPNGYRGPIRVIPTEGPLPSGLFVVEPGTGYLSTERQQEIRKLPVRLRLGLDLTRSPLIKRLVGPRPAEVLNVYDNEGTNR